MSNSIPEASIVEMPQPMGIFAGELFDRAVDYLKAFEALTEDGGKGHYYPAYFLLAHSIEIFLKAYLAAERQGVTKEEIRHLGHNLKELFNACSEVSLPFVEHLDGFVFTIHEMNRDHDFRYPSGYNLRVPSPAHCLEFVRGLQKAIQPAVSNARGEAQLRFASETHHLKGKKIRWSD